MARPRNTAGALLTLAAGAGIWAWRNRDKIRTMVNERTPQSQSHTRLDQPMTNQSMTNQPMTNQPMTGETRRIGDGDLQTYDPAI